MIESARAASPAPSAPDASFIRRIDGEITPFDPIAEYPDFERRYPDVFRVHELVGIHPGGAGTVINPYTGIAPSQSFRNIGEHCVAVAWAAEIIASSLQGKGYLSQTEVDVIVERALIHDANKPFEIMRRDARSEGADIDVYSVSAYEKLAPLLIERGIPHHLASYLAAAGSETGHNSLIDFITTDGSNITGIVAGRLAEKIVHLADDMTFTSMPKGDGRPITAFFTPWERALASQFIERYPHMWKEGLGVTADGALTVLKDIGAREAEIKVLGSYMQIQLLVARGIAREIQCLLEPDSRLEPEAFVKWLLNS